MGGEGWSREEVTRACYPAILGRPAESEAVVAEHAARHAQPETLIRAFAGSEEAEERRRREEAARRIAAAATLAPFTPGALRVLLFGAYGNGNLGDAAQAEAVAALLHHAVSRTLDIRACSWIDVAPYPFDPARRMPPMAIADPWMLREFDLLLVGGGGLFGAPHHPLPDPAWVAMLRNSGLAYGLLGPGVATTLPQEPALAAPWAALQDGALFRSARDAHSLGASAPGAEWLADPVLVAGLLAGGGQPRAPLPGTRPLLIVKRPVHAAERAFLEWAATAGQGCDLMAVEPRTERDLLPGLCFATDMAALQAACARASVVVSTRYHGCIAALLAGVPCLGFGVGKNQALMQALGAPDRYMADLGALPAALAAPLPPLPPAAFSPLRAAAEAALARLAALMASLPQH